MFTLNIFCEFQIVELEIVVYFFVKFSGLQYFHKWRSFWVQRFLFLPPSLPFLYFIFNLIQILNDPPHIKIQDCVE